MTTKPSSCSPSSNKKVHPMVAVPDAIRTVLQETARVVLERSKFQERCRHTLSLVQPQSLSSIQDNVLHGVLDDDIIMSEPGYPPYKASIMDGYAIRCKDFQQPSKNITAADTNTTSTTNTPSSLPSSSSLEKEKVQWTHQVIDKVYAGDSTDSKKVSPATSSSSSGGKDELPVAYYITTGAVVPDTCDCVVPIEECIVSSPSTKTSLDAPPPTPQKISIQSTATIQEGKWIRPIGSDIPSGSIVVPRGHIIDPVAIGLMYQAGVTQVHMKRPLRVGVLSTGNELILGSSGSSSGSIETTSSRSKGQIPDVNRPILLSLLSTFGGSGTNNYCIPVDLGMERDDDIQAMAKTIDIALETCDVIITTGGISMGETDIVEEVLIEHCGGTLHFGRMHMKPGKPTTFVTIPKNGMTRLVFAMPGNPVSATVCTQLLVRPCLDLLFHGIQSEAARHLVNDAEDTLLEHLVNNARLHPEIYATLTHDIKLDAIRPEYHRIVLQEVVDDGSSYRVSTTGIQQSSRLMSLRDAQGLLVLPEVKEGKTKALKGEKYLVLLLGNINPGRPLMKEQVRVRNSIHLRNKSISSTSNTTPLSAAVPPIKSSSLLRVAAIQVLPVGSNTMQCISSLLSTCDKIQQGLSGSKSGSVSIVSKMTYSGRPQELYNCVLESITSDVDVIVVYCTSYPGAFPHHLDISSALRQRLTKVADVLALQARQGSASNDATAALFETVVGYVPEKDGSMLVCLADRGIDSGLANIRGLLKHAVNVGRGKPHNHHHQQQQS